MIDKKSLRILKKLYKIEKMEEGETYRLTGQTERNKPNPYISVLLENRFIKHVSEGGAISEEGGFVDGISYYKITLQGRAFIEQRRHDLFMFWFPYTITTALAIAALIVAIAGLTHC